LRCFDSTFRDGFGDSDLLLPLPALQSVHGK
jgi:hypothetical protein